MLGKSVSAPSMVTASRGKQVLTVPLPVPRYWQRRHQQARVTMGAAVAVYLTAPQRHCPEIVMGAFLSEWARPDPRPVYGIFIPGIAE
jgi:hypothetical protein